MSVCKCSSLQMRNKGVMIILVWMLLINFCDPSVAQHTKKSSIRSIISLTSTLLLIVLSLMLPLATVFADLKFKGFHFTIGSILIGIIISLLYCFQSFLDAHVIDIADSPTVFKILLEVCSPLNYTFRKLFMTYMTLYGADLMTDASSSQLSSFVWWFWLAVYGGFLSTVVISCSSRILFISKDIELLVVNISHFTCLCVILVSCIMFRKWLYSVRNVYKNAVKLIAGVLYYAKYHKYPQSQSAFTYCEDAKVTRIDFGKKQYGGPYEEEDVEAVKAFFRLLPYLFCMCLIYFPFVPLGRLEENQSFSECLIGSTYFTEYIIAVFMILFHQLVLKRYCLWQEKFSMMTKVGFGLGLIVISKAMYLITEVLLRFTVFPETEALGVFNLRNLTSSKADHFDVHMYFMIFPQVVGSVGSVLCIVTSYEFIFAQCPYNMRGLVFGSLYGLNAILEQLGWWSVFLLNSFAFDVQPSLNTYVYGLSLIVMIVYWLLFCWIRKWYTFRLRNSVYSHYFAAEDYYTKLIQETEKDEYPPSLY